MVIKHSLPFGLPRLRVAFAALRVAFTGLLLIFLSVGCGRQPIPRQKSNAGKQAVDKTNNAGSSKTYEKAGGNIERPSNSIRIATFNIALNRKEAGELLAELKTGKSEQALKIAQVIRIVDPDILLINELDEAEATLPVLLKKYFHRNEGAERSFKPYRFQFTAQVNTGVDSGLDLDRDGKTKGPGDAFGFGEFPGQYSMAVLSRYPLDADSVRTFQKFLWSKMPEMKWPAIPETGESYYSDEAKKRLRLSSKSHWDVPIQLSPTRTLHFLVCHPTPPVFDGGEDRNGIRNADEIRFWEWYIQGKFEPEDDQGRTKGFSVQSEFIIAGDLNADPNDGDSTGAPIKRLLQVDSVNGKVAPSSRGAVLAAKNSAGANLKHSGNPAHDTGDFNDRNVGNLRVDYVLPSSGLKVLGQGVFWPESGAAHHELNRASDHHLVWIDIEK